MSARLDAILATVEIADVLRLAHVEPPANERKPILCPLPGHLERTPSFVVQQSGRGYRCHGCNGHGGIIELAVALGLGKDKAAAVDFLAERFRIPPSNEPARRRGRTSTAFALPPAPAETATSEDDLCRVRDALRGIVPLLGTPGATYLEGRGIDATAAAANDVRYHSNWLGRGAAVVFAIRDRAGKVVAAQGRFVDSSTMPKAMSIGPLSAGVYRTAAALQADTVAICEAPIDALSLAVSGTSAIALCGTSLTRWLRSAVAFKAVVVATDADAAGNAAAERITAEFNLGTRVLRLLLPEGVKDANALLVRDAEALHAILGEIRDRDCGADLAV